MIPEASRSGLERLVAARSDVQDRDFQNHRRTHGSARQPVNLRLHGKLTPLTWDLVSSPTIMMPGTPLTVCLCSLLLSLAAPAPRCFARKEVVVDGIAAKVNNDVITHSQVRALSAQSEANARQSLRGQALADQLKKLHTDALNILIDRQLILQEFQKLKAKGAQIPPHVLDDHIASIIRQQFGN